MSVGYSTNLQLVEPITGTESGNWGYDINYGTTDYIDISVAGTNNITTDADVTLTQTTGSTSGNNIVGTTAQYMQLLFTGSRTAARNVNAPNISKIYVVNNSTTGGYSITVRGVTGPTTGVTVINGEKCIIAWNSVSSDFVKISSNTITSFTGVLSPVNGGTGVANNAASTITISGSFGTTLTVTGTTAVTLPTSGTLLSTAAAVTPAQGGTGVANGTNNTLTFTGNYTLGLTLSSNTTVTLPATGTLASLSTAQTFTATQTFNGTSSTEAMKILNIAEPANVVGSAPSSTTNFYVNSGAVQLYTTNAANNWTVNFAFSSGTSLNTAMSVGDSISCTLLATQGATAYYNSAVTIDGTSVTPKWQGGTAPTKGNVSGIDSYTYVIVKTASATYTVLATQTQFA